MLDKKLAMAKLIKAGLTVKDGKIAKKQILAAYKVLANGDLDYDSLREKANIGADGMGALDAYMEKYFGSATGESELHDALTSFKSDCEDYIFPAIDSMLECLGSAESGMVKADTDDLSTVHHLDSYFKDCEESGQGINTKESMQMHNALVRLLKERMGYALDLNDEFVSENGKNALQRAMDVAYPGMRKMFAKAEVKLNVPEGTTEENIKYLEKELQAVTNKIANNAEMGAQYMGVSRERYSDIQRSNREYKKAVQDKLKELKTKSKAPKVAKANGDSKITLEGIVAPKGWSLKTTEVANMEKSGYFADVTIDNGRKTVIVEIYFDKGLVAAFALPSGGTLGESVEIGTSSDLVDPFGIRDTAKFNKFLNEMAEKSEKSEAKAGYTSIKVKAGDKVKCINDKTHIRQFGSGKDWSVPAGVKEGEIYVVDSIAEDYFGANKLVLIVNGRKQVVDPLYMSGMDYKQRFELVDQPGDKIAGVI